MLGEGTLSLAIASDNRVSGMRDALPRMARLASLLASGAEVGSPEEEGYLARGFRRNRRAEGSGAERAIDLVLAKLEGDTRSEVAGLRNGAATASRAITAPIDAYADERPFAHVIRSGRIS